MLSLSAFYFSPLSSCPAAHITLIILDYPLPLVMDKGTAYRAAGRQAANVGPREWQEESASFTTGWMLCQAAGGENSGGLRGTLVWQEHKKLPLPHKNHQLSPSYALFQEMCWTKVLRDRKTKQKPYRNKQRTNTNICTCTHTKTVD